MKRFGKRTWVLLAAISAAVVAAVGGYAYWTTTGEGAGSASTGIASNWDVDTTAVTGGPLTPGGGAGTYQSLTYTVTNPSTGHQNLANVLVKVATSTGAAWSADACTANDFQLSLDGGSTWGLAGAPVNDTQLAGNADPGEVRGPADVTIRMVDSGANQDDCQDVSVPLYLLAS